METYDRCMDLAMRYLGYRARTEKELSDYLLRREMPPEAVGAVIERLREYRYLDDSAFALRFALSRVRKGGARKIAYELRQKGVDSETIDAVIGQIDPDEELVHATAHARKALRGESDAKARGRAYAAVSRRGYGGDVARMAIDAALGELEAEDEEEWE